MILCCSNSPSNHSSRKARNHNLKFHNACVLTIQNELVFKGQPPVIPAALQKEIMAVVHSSHIGTEGCICRASDTFYWPCISCCGDDGSQLVQTYFAYTKQASVSKHQFFILQLFSLIWFEHLKVLISVFAGHSSGSDILLLGWSYSQLFHSNIHVWYVIAYLLTLGSKIRDFSKMFKLFAKKKCKSGKRTVLINVFTSEDKETTPLGSWM